MNRISILALTSLLMAGCASRKPVVTSVPPAVAPGPASVRSLAPEPHAQPEEYARYKATAPNTAVLLKDGNTPYYSTGPCSPAIAMLATMEADPTTMVFCLNYAPDRVPVIMFQFPNQAPLTPQNFPAMPGIGGFVYDGGNSVKIIFSDKIHMWALDMNLVGSVQ